jgi:leucyl/phenylalanyl-tRNA--protein transferase
MRRPIWLPEDAPPESLPPAGAALAEPDGLLAVGGALTPEWLLHAYRHGVFPWYSPGQPILWWSPDPRTVLFPEEFRCSRSLAQSIRNRGYETRLDTAFESVIDACAAPRATDSGTWITREMRNAYIALHRLGLAHSVETWSEDRLVGGLSGVAIGRVFYGSRTLARARFVELLADWADPVMELWRDGDA